MGFLSRLIDDAAGGRHVSRREALYGFIGTEKKRSPTRSLFDERLFQERLFPPRFLSIYLSIQPPSALNPRPITSWPSVYSSRLRSTRRQRPRGFIYWGKTRNFANYGLHGSPRPRDKVEERGRRARERIIEKWRERRALISQASGVPYDSPTPF